MPKTNGLQPIYVIDCSGLAKVSQTNNNALRSTAIGLLESGKMVVPTGVADELKKAFDDEYDDLQSHIKTRIRVKPAHIITAGSIASKSNSAFRLEPYDSSDWIAAAVAVCEECIVITTKDKKGFYLSILKCKVLTVDELVE